MTAQNQISAMSNKAPEEPKDNMEWTFPSMTIRNIFTFRPSPNTYLILFLSDNLSSPLSPSHSVTHSLSLAHTLCLSLKSLHPLPPGQLRLRHKAHAVQRERRIVKGCRDKGWRGDGLKGWRAELAKRWSSEWMKRWRGEGGRVRKGRDEAVRRWGDAMREGGGLNTI